MTLGSAKSTAQYYLPSPVLHEREEEVEAAAAQIVELIEAEVSSGAVTHSRFATCVTCSSLQSNSGYMTGYVLVDSAKVLSLSACHDDRTSH